MFERVIGRANHMFFHINIREVLCIKSYNEVIWDDKAIRKYKFVINNDKEKWYVIEFMRDGKIHRLITEPNDSFLNGLLESVEISKSPIK